MFSCPQVHIWANHYVILPYHQSGMKTLGLKGRYIYLSLCGIDNKQFTIHLDFAFSASKNARISLSNIYKEEKYNHFSIQVPLDLSDKKWAVVCLDCKGLLEKYHCFKPESELHFLRSIMVCANLKISRVATSDNLYDFNSLPRDINFKLTKENIWDKLYSWIEPMKCDHVAAIKERMPQPKPQKVIEKKPYVSKKVRKMEEEKKLKVDSENQVQNFQTKIETEMEEPVPSSGPLLELKEIIGCTINTCPSICCTRDPNSKEMVFASGSLAVAMDLTGKKRFFRGHTNCLVSLSLSSQGDLLCTADDSTIKVWNFAEARCIGTWHTDTRLKHVSLSSDSTFLASVGKNMHNNDVLTLWDMRTVHKVSPCQPTPKVVASQISQLNILCLRFAPDSDLKDIQQLQMCTCGQENIRFWRMKNGVLRNAPVVLEKGSRNTVFTTLGYEGRRRVYVGSKEGTVLQINAESQELEFVFRLHDAGIHSIAVNEAFCVTGSDDLFLRVWPLDFSEFFMEAKHEDTVRAVDISSDGVAILCATAHGSVGLLDISQQKYSTLMRSHAGAIIAMDSRNHNIITVSTDKTIRLWDSETLQQAYEFCSYEDQSLAVALHPAGNSFACGFQSGTLRIFDIEKTAVTNEFRYFDKPLSFLKFLDNNTLLIICEDGSFSILNSSTYAIIKQVIQDYPTSSNTCTVSPKHQYLVTVGKKGNEILVWNLENLEIKTTFPTGTGNIRGICFINEEQIALISSESKFKLFSLEGIPLYQANAQIGPVGKSLRLALAPDAQQIIIVGTDSKVRMLSIPNLKTLRFPSVPFVQVKEFGNHIELVHNAMFCPWDPTILFTAGSTEGLYIWHYQNVCEEVEMIESNDVVDPSAILIDPLRARLVQAEEESEEIIPAFESERDQKRDNLNLPRKHYVTTRQAKTQLNADASTRMLSTKDLPLEIDSIHGYNGNSHDNIIYLDKYGLIIYSVGSKLVVEELASRKQEIFINQEAEISTLAFGGGFLATATGFPNKKSSAADICLYEFQPARPYLNFCKPLSFHHKGVQSLLFIDQMLISVGRFPECSIAYWNCLEGSCVASTLLEFPTNQIITQPNSNALYAVGKNKVARIIIRDSQIFTDMNELSSKAESFGFSFSSAAFYGSWLLLGTTSGTLVVFDTNSDQFIEESPISEEEISCLNCDSSYMAVCSGKKLLRWEIIKTPKSIDSKIKGASRVGSTFKLSFAELSSCPSITLDSHIISLDVKGFNAIAGTNSGTLWHLAFNKGQYLPLHTSNLNSKMNALCLPHTPSILAIAAASLRIVSSKACEELISYPLPDTMCSLLLVLPSLLVAGCNG